MRQHAGQYVRRQGRNPTARPLLRGETQGLLDIALLAIEQHQHELVAHAAAYDVAQESDLMILAGVK